MEPHKLIGLAEMARELGRHPETIRRHVAVGHIPALRLGPRGDLMFDRLAVRHAIQVRPFQGTDDERGDAA